MQYKIAALLLTAYLTAPATSAPWSVKRSNPFYAPQPASSSSSSVVEATYQGPTQLAFTSDAKIQVGVQGKEPGTITREVQLQVQSDLGSVQASMEPLGRFVPVTMGLMFDEPLRVLSDLMPQPTPPAGQQQQAQQVMRSAVSFYPQDDGVMFDLRS